MFLHFLPGTKMANEIVRPTAWIHMRTIFYSCQAECESFSAAVHSRLQRDFRVRKKDKNVALQHIEALRMWWLSLWCPRTNSPEGCAQNQNTLISLWDFGRAVEKRFVWNVVLTVLLTVLNPEPHGRDIHSGVAIACLCGFRFERLQGFLHFPRRLQK